MLLQFLDRQNTLFVVYFHFNEHGLYVSHDSVVNQLHNVVKYFCGEGTSTEIRRRHS